ncbi:Chemotaxis signal transduction protein [Candidatus Desulfosporosinus infrequens]|uniref:Chemotaxis signal transduction protein n=1 Tax=Candidatus Desulfosporosinus infrequens TaxID=2043169 RepID=A0A2U3K3Z4_9FIRM|nr:Chemotaxis signal transduction protein [Candidatus Desulfosporosinus infrequens]
MADIVEQDSQDQDEDTQKGKFLTFCMGNDFYGIEIKYVTEIVGLQPITEIPEMPEYIKGIINLRGKIIPVMDVRLRFRKPFREYNDRTCIVVIEINEVSVGLIVDSVSEVIAIPDEEIVVPPSMAKEGNKYIKGIGKVGTDVKLLLDSDKVLNDTELEGLSEL